MNAATTSKLLGINDETHVCECCGKQNLKRVAVIELANGSVVRYGTDCAGRELGRGMKNAIEEELSYTKMRPVAIAFINTHQYKLNPHSIAASVSVKVPCYFDGRSKSFDIAGVKYTPDVYRDSVNWWAA